MEIAGRVYEHSHVQHQEHETYALTESYRSIKRQQNRPTRIDIHLTSLSRRQFLQLLRLAGPLTGPLWFKSVDGLIGWVVIKSASYEINSRDHFSLKLNGLLSDGSRLTTSWAGVFDDWRCVVDEDFESWTAGTIASPTSSSGRTDGRQIKSVDWTVDAGTVDIVTSTVYAGSNSMELSSGDRITINEYISNVRLTAMFNITGSTGIAHFYLRYVDTSNWVGIKFDGLSKISLRYSISGTITEVWFTLGTALTVGVWNYVVVEVLDRTLTVKINGETFDAVVQETVTKIGQISVLSSTITMYIDQIVVERLDQPVLVTPPGSISRQILLENYDTAWSTIQRVIGREVMDYRWDETGPDCLVYVDFREGSVGGIRNYGRTRLGIATNGKILWNGGVSGHALRLDSDLTYQGTLGYPENSKWMHTIGGVPLGSVDSAEGVVTIRMRFRWLEGGLSEAGSYGILFTPLSATYGPTVHVFHGVGSSTTYSGNDAARDMVGPDASQKQKYQVIFTSVMDDSWGSEISIWKDVQEMVWYDLVFVCDMKRHYHVTYINGVPLGKRYNQKVAKDTLIVSTSVNLDTLTAWANYDYTIAAQGMSSTNPAGYGRYMSKIDVDLFAIYKAAIHPMSSDLPFIPQHSVKALRLPWDSIVDQWSSAREHWLRLNQGWISAIRDEAFLLDTADNPNYVCEVGTLSAGTLHGGGLWSSLHKPELGMYNSIVNNGLDSNIRVDDKDGQQKYWQGGNLTVMFWYRVDSAETAGYMFSCPFNSTGEYVLKIQVAASAITVHLPTWGSHASTTALYYLDIVDDRWHFYTLVLSSIGWLLYIDGEIVRTQCVQMDSWNPSAARTAANKVLGTLYNYGTSGWAGNTGYTLEGYFTFLGYVHRALTRAEVKQFYCTYPRRTWFVPSSRDLREFRYGMLEDADDTRLGSEAQEPANVLLRYNMEEGQNVYLHDTGLTEAHLTMANGPAWVAGPFEDKRWAVYFDGADDYATNSAVSQQLGFPTTSDERTYAFWAKLYTDASAVNQWFWSAYDPVTLAYLGVYWDYNAGVLRFFAKDGALVSKICDFTNQSTVNDGKWHHYTIVVDTSSDTVRLYIDGALDSTHTSLVARPSISGTAQFTVGTYVASTGYCALCTFASIEVYAVELTSTEVKALYDEGIGGLEENYRSATLVHAPSQFEVQQSGDVKVVGDLRDSLWIDYGLAALHCKRAVYDGGGLEVHVWDPEAGLWDMVGIISIKMDDKSSETWKIYVTKFQLVEITPNLAIVKAYMVSDEELDAFWQDTGKYPANQVIAVCRLEAGKFGVAVQMEGVLQNDNDVDNSSRLYAVMFATGGGLNVATSGTDMVFSLQELGRVSSATSSGGNTDIPIGVMLKYDRGYVGFAGISTYTGQAGFLARKLGAAYHYGFSNVDTDTWFVVGGVPHEAHILYPRNDGESDVTYSSGATAGASVKIGSDYTADAYVCMLDGGIPAYVEWSLSTLPAGRYMAACRLAGTTTTTAYFRVYEGATVLETHTVAYDSVETPVIMFVADGTSEYKLRAYSGGAGTNYAEVDYMTVVPLENGRDMPMDAWTQCLTPQHIRLLGIYKT